jgi:hypothetical protein
MENSMPNKLDSQHNEKRSPMNKWSVKLAILGIVMGIFTTLSMGYTNIGFMIGFGLPMAAILGFVGLIIDVIKRK